MMEQKIFKVTGNLVDIHTQTIYPAEIEVENGKIKSIQKTEETYSNYILPGFINAHVHIESSMLTPASFAKVAVTHGTVATVSDPHEIANVLGIEGIDYMINNAKTVPLKIFFGAPSCVPATSFETSGAIIDAKETEKLLQRDDIWYLSEMMNFPGVIFGDEEVHAKLKAAQVVDKPIDGHAPFLMGEKLEKYAAGGITTDHECVTVEEAEQKIALGIKVQIREGSAAKNFEVLHPLISKHSKNIMLCTDDSHPDDLINGFMNTLVKRAVEKGHNLFDVLKTVSSNVVEHYKLPVGLLRENDAADFIVVDDLKEFKVRQTYINGDLVFDQNKISFDITEKKALNKFERQAITLSDLEIHLKKDDKLNVIEVYDGDLTTGKVDYTLKQDGNFESDLDSDILKIVVLSRYDNEKVQIGFIHGFGMKQGAFASSIAHDSHNIVAVGTNNQDLLQAINTLIDNKGGLSFSNQNEQKSLKLEIAGLMTNESIHTVAEKYKEINDAVINTGSPLKAPLMTAAFMSLLVIPKLKLGDKGLFDVDKFEFTNLVI